MLVSILSLLIVSILGLARARPDFEFQGSYGDSCSNTTFELRFEMDQSTKIVNITYSENVTFCDSRIASYHSRLVGRCRNGYTINSDKEIACNSTFWEPANPQQIYVTCLSADDNDWKCTIKFYNDSIMKLGPMSLKNTKLTNQTTKPVSQASFSHLVPTVLMVSAVIPLFTAIA